MGGNICVNGNRVDTLDVRKHHRDKFICLFMGMIGHLNYLFNEKEDELIWDLSVPFMYLASGSSKFLFTKDLFDLYAAKPTFGDIDFFVPKEKKDKFISYIDSLKGRELIRYFTFIGHNKEGKKANNQINCLFRYFPGEHAPLNIQVDFEFVEFQKGAIPSVFSVFSRSSSWEDIEMGIKGVQHKYLITSIFQTGQQIDGIIVTPTSTRLNLKISKKKINPSEYCFSVSHGVRKKFKLAFSIDVVNYYKEIPPNERKYFNDLHVIYDLMFEDYDMYCDNIDYMWSFVGIVTLLKELSVPDERIERIFRALIEINFGKKAQKLSRDPKVDAEIKLNAVKYFANHFKFLYYETYLAKINQYYKNF